MPKSAVPLATGSKREVSLFRNGRNQALRVPREFELPGRTALIYQDGGRLIIEPRHDSTLQALLAGWTDLEDDLPPIEDEPMPLDTEIF
jgi:antitoxin VapB